MSHSVTRSTIFDHCVALGGVRSGVSSLRRTCCPLWSTWISLGFLSGSLQALRVCTYTHTWSTKTVLPMYLSLVGYPPCRQATSPGGDETSWSTETTSPGRSFVLGLISLSFSCFCLHCFLHILEAMQSLQSGGLWPCLSILLKIDEMPCGRCFCFAMWSMVGNEACILGCCHQRWDGFPICPVHFQR
jgi:hypothetical protein